MLFHNGFVSVNVLVIPERRSKLVWRISAIWCTLLRPSPIIINQVSTFITVVEFGSLLEVRNLSEPSTAVGSGAPAFEVADHDRRRRARLALNFIAIISS